MKRSFIVILVLLVVFSQEMLSQISHKTLWKFKAGDKILASPVIDQGNIYIGSDDGYLYCLQEKTGEINWKFKTFGVIRSGAKIYENKIAFLSGDSKLYVLDLKSGREIWNFTTRGEKEYDCWDYYLSVPEICGEIICFGSGDGYIYGLDKNTGHKKWEVKTDNVVHSTAAVIDKNVYFGSFDGNLYSINSENGSVNWKFKTIGNYGFKKGEIQGSAAVLGGFLLFGSRDYNLYAVEAKTGTGAFNEVINSWIVSKPTVSEKSVYFGNSDNTFLWRFDPYKNGLKWKTEVSLNVFSDAVIYNEYVLFGSFNGRLYFAHNETGKISYYISTESSEKNYYTIFDNNDKEKKEIRENLKSMADYCALYNEKYFSLGSIMGTPSVNNNVIYVPSTEGILYAYELIRN